MTTHPQVGTWVRLDAAEGAIHGWVARHRSEPKPILDPSGHQVALGSVLSKIEVSTPGVTYRTDASNWRFDPEQKIWTSSL